VSQALDLNARLEGGPSTVTAGGTTYTYRHPTKEQIAAAMSLAGVDVSALSAASESGEATTATMELAARMGRANELLGAMCVTRVDVPDGSPIRRVRNSLQLLQLPDEALDDLAPQIERIGEYLFEQSSVGDGEGKD